MAWGGIGEALLELGLGCMRRKKTEKVREALAPSSGEVEVGRLVHFNEF